LEAIHKAPAYPDPYILLSTIYESRGNVEKAFQLSFVAAHLQPGNLDGWVNLARHPLATINQRIYCMTKAISAASSGSSGQAESGDRDEGQATTADEEKGTEANKNDVLLDLQAERLNLYLDAEHSRAISECRKLAERMPVDRAIHTVTSVAEACQDHADAVASMIAEFLAKPRISSLRDDRIYTLVNYMCDMHERRSNYQAILDCLEPYIRDDSAPVELRLKYGMALLFTGHEAEARRQLVSQCLLLNPLVYFDEIYAVALSLMKQELRTDAITLLERLTEYWSVQAVPLLYLQMGHALHANGEYVRAEHFFRSVLAEVPTNMDARMTLNECLKAMGRESEALEVLKEYDVEAETVRDMAEVRYAVVKAINMLKSGHSREAVTSVFPVLLQVLHLREADLHLTEYESRQSLVLHPENLEFTWKAIVQATSEEDALALLLHVAANVDPQQASVLLYRAISLRLYPKESLQLNLLRLAYVKVCLASGMNAEAYSQAKQIVLSYSSNVAVWNMASSVGNLLTGSQYRAHFRFARRRVRMLLKNKPEDHLDEILCGRLLVTNYSHSVGMQRHSLAEYYALWLEYPENPLVSLCLASAYATVTLNRRFPYWSAACVAAYAALNNCADLAEQAAPSEYRRTAARVSYLYNKARLLQSIDQNAAAAEVYESVLTHRVNTDDQDPEGVLEPVVRKAAWNLAVLYRSSGNLAKAKGIVQEYLSV
jgi:hypothetical protein